MRRLLTLLIIVGTTCAEAEAQNSLWKRVADAYRLEPEMLYAIALQESRRLWQDQTVRPWPWTLHVKPHGAFYFESYDEAANQLARFITEDGLTNIDIGIMQINWKYHSHRIADPARLLLPENNLRIGATILRENLDRVGGDVKRAVGLYFSSDPAKSESYAESVLSILDGLKKLPGFKAALLL